MSVISDPRELIQFVLAHARGIFNVQQMTVLSLEGLQYPQYHIVLYAERSGSRGGTIVENQIIA